MTISSQRPKGNFPLDVYVAVSCLLVGLMSYVWHMNLTCCKFQVNIYGGHVSLAYKQQIKEVTHVVKDGQV